MTCPNAANTDDHDLVINDRASWAKLPAASIGDIPALTELNAAIALSGLSGRRPGSLPLTRVAAMPSSERVSNQSALKIWDDANRCLRRNDRAIA